MSQKLWAYISLTSASFIWGMSFIWTKDIFNFWGPFTLCFFRMILAAFFIYIYAKSRGLSLKISGSYGSFVLMAFCEPFIYFIGESYGLMEVSPGIASLVIGSIPIFLGLSTVFYGKEKAKKGFFLGAMFSILGLLIVSIDLEGNLRYSAKGLGLLFLAVTSAVAYNQIIRKLSDHHSSYTIVFWQSLIGAFLFLPFFLGLEARAFSVGWPYGVEVWWPFLLLTCLASTLSFIIYNQAMKVIGMLRSNIFVSLIPAFALTASIYLGMEEFKWYKVIGLALMILGVMKASQKHMPESG